MKKLKIIEKINIIFLLIVVILIPISILFSFIFNKTEKETLEIESKTSKFDYVSYIKDSSYYKEEFNNLIKILDEKEVNKEEYAKSISKLFIIDFYTLNNKISSSDIGGLQYVHDDLKDNLILNASSTIYKHIMTKNFEAPIVNKITVGSVLEGKYIYDNKEYQSFDITLEWDYEKDLGYEKTSKLTLILEGEQIFIVEKKEL